MSATGTPSSGTSRTRSPARRRDRRGRGRRGPLAWPPVPTMVTRRDRFDEIVRDVAEEVDLILEPRGLVVEYATMDHPIDLGPAWAPEVPLARTVAATRTSPPRIIVFRRPIESRVCALDPLDSLIRSAICAEVGTLFALPPDELLGPDPHGR